MPRKAKTEETVVTEESAILETAETGTLMEGDSPAEGETLMDGETPADGNFPMDGELPGAGEAATDEELPSSDEAAVEGDILEDTSPSGEDMDAEAETGNDGGMELQPEDTGEAPAEGAGDADTNASEPAPELPPKTGAGDGTGTGKNVPEVSAPPRKRRTKASAPEAKPETPVRKAAPSTILTLNADSEVETPESREDTIWHELQNAYRTRKMGHVRDQQGKEDVEPLYLCRKLRFFRLRSVYQVICGGVHLPDLHDVDAVPGGRRDLDELPADVAAGPVELMPF